MHYLINSLSGIFVTKMDKYEILSQIQERESHKVYSGGNTMWDSQQRLQFIIDVLTFLNSTFTKELYHVEKWKNKILFSLQKEDGLSNYGWTQLAASEVVGEIKLLLIKDNTIAYDSLPICTDTKSIPVPHTISTGQGQRSNTESIIDHTATAIMHRVKVWYAQDTYNFYNKMICTLENEQRFLGRQLSLFESKLLIWARTERDHANEAVMKDGFKTVVHAVCSIGGLIEEGVRQQNSCHKLIQQQYIT